MRFITFCHNLVAKKNEMVFFPSWMQNDRFFFLNQIIRSIDSGNFNNELLRMNLEPIPF